MIFFYNIFSDEKNNVIELEKEFLASSLDSQVKTKKIILNFIQNFINFDSNDLEGANKVLNFLESLKNCLELCNNNITYLNSLSSKFNDVVLAINNKSENLDEVVNSFNKDYIDSNRLLIKNNLNIQNCFDEISQKSKPDLYNKTSNVESLPIASEIPTESPEITNKANVSEITNTTSQKKYQENTLVISETTKQVTLPYELSKLNETLQKNPDKYSSIDDIISQKYTISTRKFNNPFTSRFKEAYKLIKNKEHGSTTDALELGLELMFNNNLHPAVISACKNLDELDIYLDYLEDGKVNNFNCFKIIFEMPPLVSKKNNNKLSI